MCETTDLIYKLAKEGRSKQTIADELGISRRKLSEIIEAMGDVVIQVYPTYTVQGKTGTIAQLVAAFGNRCTANTVRGRIRNGMTVEDAILTPTFGTHTVRGKTGSVEELVKHFRLSIKPSTVINRLWQLGMDIEKALFTPVNQVRRKNASQRSAPKSSRSVYSPIHVQQVRVPQ